MQAAKSQAERNAKFVGPILMVFAIVSSVYVGAIAKVNKEIQDHTSFPARMFQVRVQFFFFGIFEEHKDAPCNTQTYAYKHACMHAYVVTYILNTCIHTNTYVYTHIRT